MKTIAFLPLLLAGATAFAAGPPVKKSVQNYLHLSQNSPFTTKPLPPTTERVDTTFEDWALGGVSEVEGGYMVTLIHKKNQGETQVIKPRGTVHNKKDTMEWLNPGATGSFKVETVSYGKTSWKDTTVVISSGSRKGTMKFDDKQLMPTASAAPVQNRQPGQPGQPPQPGVAPGQPPQPGGGRQQRTRVVTPPPSPAQQPQGRPNR